MHTAKSLKKYNSKYVFVCILRFNNQFTESMKFGQYFNN